MLVTRISYCKRAAKHTVWLDNMLSIEYRVVGKGIGAQP